MKSNTRLLVIFLIFSLQFLYSQNKITTKLPDTITNWTKENKVGFDMSQIGFINWNAGGNNSVTGLLKGSFTRLYKYGNLKWNNELIFRYGVNKQDGDSFKKTDDALQVNSTFGYRSDTISSWYYSGKFNFNTQFTNGYAYPNTDKAISKYFAPAYFFLGIGTEYVSKKNKMNFYISPLTMKATLVIDEVLANEGAYGVTKATYDVNGNIITRGKKSKTELGFLFTLNHKDEIYKNMILENRLVLYSDYINNFGNIDVDWQVLLELTVNQYVKASIGTHIIYDDDIKAKQEFDGRQITIGPKIQLKQILGIGLTYSF
jgi:Protein of unknown function (DUF3078)